jgi:hypothetical protein
LLLSVQIFGRSKNNRECKPGNRHHLVLNNEGRLLLVGPTMAPPEGHPLLVPEHHGVAVVETTAVAAIEGEIKDAAGLDRRGQRKAA